MCEFKRDEMREITRLKNVCHPQKEQQLLFRLQ